MRYVVLLLCLCALTARAQQPDAPTRSEDAEPTPPPVTAADGPPPQPAPPRPASADATVPAEPAAVRAVRYSRASAGPGGPMLAFTEVVAGLVTGGMLGHDYEERNGAYTGAVVGGLTLGTAAIVYQYFVPVERRESLLVAGGSVVGFLAGVGLSSEQGLDDSTGAWISLAATQAGILGALLATAGEGDVSAGDASLVGMTTLYALVLTGLTQSLVAGSADSNLTPTFVAPALGFALGGALTHLLELEEGRAFKLTLVPLGVGLAMRYLGSAFADGRALRLTALAGIVTSFALTALLT